MTGDRPDPLSDFVSVACGDANPALFFSERPSKIAQAKALCGTCATRLACLAWALGNNERFGVWGGLSVEERDRHTRELVDRGRALDTLRDRRSARDSSIRHLKESGLSTNALASRYGLSERTILRISTAELTQ